MKRTITILLSVLLLGVCALPLALTHAQSTSVLGNGTSVTGNSTSVSSNATSVTGGSTSSGCTSSGSSTGVLTNPLKVSCLSDLIAEIMKIVVLLGGMFLTLMLIYTGFLFVQARGNEEKISSARTSLLWTVIGGLILLGAQAIATAITTTASSL